MAGTSGNVSTGVGLTTASIRILPAFTCSAAAEIPVGMKSTSPPSIAVNPGPSPPNGIAVTSKSAEFLINAPIVLGKPPGPVEPILTTPGLDLISAMRSCIVLYLESVRTAITATPRPRMLTG